MQLLRRCPLVIISVFSHALLKWHSILPLKALGDSLSSLPIPSSPPKYTTTALCSLCARQGLPPCWIFHFWFWKTTPPCNSLNIFEKMGECSSRSGGIWEASTALCLHVPVALTLDMGGLGENEMKKNPHCSLLNVSVLSTHLHVQCLAHTCHLFIRVSAI